MIDIDFTNPVHQIRAAIGDPNTEFVTDATILSALATSSSDQDIAALKVVNLMCNAFSTLADREREGGVEVYYTNLYERYTKLKDGLKKKIGYKSPSAGIIIGGVSSSEKNKIWEDVDKFTMYHMAEWHTIMLEENRLYNNLVERPLRGV